MICPSEVYSGFLNKTRDEPKQPNGRNAEVVKLGKCDYLKSNSPAFPRWELRPCWMIPEWEFLNAIKNGARTFHFLAHPILILKF